MPVVVTAAERASFRRCRRQWDFGAGMRQDLEPVRRPAVPDLDRAVRDALAVYYFPGMWAPAVDRFAPVLVETDFELDVLDPARPDTALVTTVGELIRYSGRIDMMAVDQHDAYWIVRHRVVDADWPPTDQLVADEESLAACWAWEQFYIGMAITGTVYNELRRPSNPAAGP